MTVRSSHITVGVPSHHPRDYDEDNLGYRDYADAFLNQIEELKVNNSGVTFGIFGEWGIGKSSMLHMIKHKLQTTNKYLVVEFDAWRYLKQEELWLALLRKIIAAIETRGPWDIFQINLALFLERVKKASFFSIKTFYLFLISIAIGVLIGFLLSILNIIFAFQVQIIAWLLAGGSGVALLFTLIFKLIETASKAIGKITLNLPKIVERKPGFDQKQPISIDDFREDFQTIVNKVGVKQTIVVLIDDLDRCPPEQVVPVLEAIKHFGLENLRPNNAKAEGALIIFILAIDRDVIEQSIRGYFKDYFQSFGEDKQKDFEISSFAREYIEKIIQIHFELPPLSPFQLNLLLNTYLREFREKNPNIDQETITKIKTILGLNPMSQPRAVLQAYSAFLNRWKIFQQRGIQNDIDPSILVVLLVIQYVWPNVFERICIYPQQFFYLHALTTGTKNNTCEYTEIDEVRELGLAVDEKETQFAVFRHNRFAMLMRKLGSLGNLSINTIQPYLSLSNENSQTTIQPEETNQIEQIIQPEQIWEVLQSGDPIRIKYVLQKEPVEVRKIFRWYTITYLAEITDQIEKKPEVISNRDVEVTEKALVAAGIINDQQVIPTIKDLLLSDSVPSRLQARAVYTLGHYAAKGNGLATSALVEAIKSEINIPQAIRTRAAHLLRYCNLGNNDIDLVFNELKQLEQSLK